MTFPLQCHCAEAKLATLGAPLIDASQSEALTGPAFAAALEEVVAARAQSAMSPEVRERVQRLMPDLEAGAKRMEKGIIKAALKNAASTTALQLSLNAMPVVGTALAGIASLISTFGSKKYTERCQKYVKDEAAKLQATMAKQQQLLDQALSGAYKSAHKGAIELALSNQPLEDVSTDQGDFLNPGTYHGSIDGLGIVDKLTGRDVWKKCKRLVDEEMGKARKTIKEATEPQIAKAKTRGFRDQLRVEVARQLRMTPSLLLFYREFGMTSPQDWLRDVVDAEGRYRRAALSRASGGAPQPGLSVGAKVGLAAAAAGAGYFLLKG